MIACIEGTVLSRQSDSLVIGLGGLAVRVYAPADLLAATRQLTDIPIYQFPNHLLPFDKSFALC